MQAKDPVCGMTIDSERAAAMEKYEGGTYYFCSSQCHNQFKVAPERYASKGQETQE